MSITRSYNKYTDTYYAYDTVYVWNEKLQKKVQQKKCIGKYDPKTGEIIPTGKRGRPLKQAPNPSESDIQACPSPDISLLESKAKSISDTLDAIEALIGKAAGDIMELRKSFDELVGQIRTEE